MSDISDWQIVIILLFGPLFAIGFMSYCIYENIKDKFS